MDRKFTLIVGVSLAAHGAAFWISAQGEPPRIEFNQGKMSVAVTFVAPVTPTPPTPRFEPLDLPSEPETKPVEPTKVAEPVPAPLPTELAKTVTEPKPVEVAAAALPTLPPPPAPQETPPTPPDPQPTAQPQPASTASQGVRTTEPPVQLPQNREPKYPRRALERNIEGTVKLELLVLSTGRVAEVKVLSSSGHRLLDDAAEKAVAQWIFEPAKRNGKPITFLHTVDCKFRIEPK